MLAYHTRIRSFELSLTDDDRDGVITVSQPIPFRSIWVAIDRRSGDLSIPGTRKGYEARERSFPAHGLKRRHGNDFEFLELEMAAVEVILLRPEWEELLQRVTGGK